MKVDYDFVRNLEFAARRHRAEMIAGLIAAAFVWLVARKPRVQHAARPHFAR